MGGSWDSRKGLSLGTQGSVGAEREAPVVVVGEVGRVKLCLASWTSLEGQCLQASNLCSYSLTNVLIVGTVWSGCCY